MLSRTVLRPLLTFSLSLRRASSTVAPYTLDRTHFNADLYARLRTVWFSDLDLQTSFPPMPTLQRWFGFNVSQEQKDAFDEECRAVAAPALESISPETVALPQQTGDYDQEVAQASEIAGPLITEVESAGNEREKAETLLSLVLLLDQMPRNIYRTRATLPLVYNHYDRLSHALVRGAMDMQPSPLYYPLFIRQPVWGYWNLMPLEHSEFLPAHATQNSFEVAMKTAITEAGDEDAMKYFERAAESEREHLEVLERFGRYPQRNQALGRRSTEEEKAWLKESGGFGVKQEDEEEVAEKGKDEL